MLLTHTAGFGYTFFSDRLRKWSFPAGIDEFSGRFQDMLMPLLFQPGEDWQYGVSSHGGVDRTKNEPLILYRSTWIGLGLP